MKYQVIVDGITLDIAPDQVIALTLQAADFASGAIDIRRASYTNQITVPKTQSNTAALGYVNLIGGVGTFPSSVKVARILASGIEIMVGVVMVKSTYKSYELQFYSLSKALSLSVGDKMLDELDFGDSPITWDAAYWDAHRASTSGICCPVINYGQIDSSLADGTIGDYYLPSVSYKDILTTILDNAGYTVSGTFYTSDTVFNNMVMTYGRKAWPGTSFKINEILPDNIRQASFLSDLAVRFGVFYKVVGNNVELVTLESILTNTANAVQWTRANNKNVIQYEWDGFCKENKFTYPKQRYSDLGLDIYTTNDGSLDVDNDNLETSRVVYESIFAPQESYIRLGSPEFTGNIIYNIASVSNNIFGATQRVWESIPISYEFDNDPLPMLCLLRDPTTLSSITESTIKYNGSARADYKIAFFALPPFSVLPSTSYSPDLDNMKWANDFGTAKGFLELYYPTFQSILNSGTYKVTRDFKLTDKDIFELDLLTPVFDEGDYFLINSVKSYVSGRVTEVDLLRIGY